MSTSRRTFLCQCGGAAAAMQLPLEGLSQAATLASLPPKNGDGFIRLNSNENAYGPSPKVLEAIQSAGEEANRYPRMHYDSLVEQIASVHHVRPEQVLLGCGSSEVLSAAAFAFLGTGKRLIHASPTFDALENHAKALGTESIPVPLRADFAHDLDAMAAHAGVATVAYICNPNNPTASLTPRRDLETFIGKLPATTLVLIDEAYHHYVNTTGMYASFIDRPLEDERVIVTRTFSAAYALAGLRIGYAIASPGIIREMRKFVTQDNINVVAAKAAAVALSDTAALSESIQRNANARQEFFNSAMARALKPIDSHANFVMMNSFRPAEDMIEHFRNNRILIGPYFPQMETFIRVSLGRPEEMRAFWHAWDLLPRLNNLMSH